MSDLDLEIDAVNYPVEVRIGAASRNEQRAIRVTRTSSSAHDVTLIPYTSETIDQAKKMVLTRTSPTVTLAAGRTGWFRTSRPVKPPPDPGELFDDHQSFAVRRARDEAPTTDRSGRVGRRGVNRV